MTLNLYSLALGFFLTYVSVPAKTVCDPVHDWPQHVPLPAASGFWNPNDFHIESFVEFAEV